MCGITGWVDYTNSLENELITIRKMTKTLEKRGPDAENIWLGKHIALGHRRLAVVDLENGHQPMTKGNCTISYNGELYNTEELRKELLEKGHTFTSYSDTEVLLTAYLEWQEDCLHRLNGIFAFAIWDNRKERLFLARDRLGVKPLFFKKTETALYFGSEIKALLAHPKIKAQVDNVGLAEILGLGPSHTPGNAVLKGIEELSPAHSLSFSKDEFSIHRYWNVESKPHANTFEETVEQVRFFLEDAIHRQLVSDVPLCTFLSGGVDSSAITAFATEKIPSLHTYSIDCEDNDRYFTQNDFQPSADSKWIEMMTNALQTEHHYLVISNDTLKEYLTEAVIARDLPGMADVDSSLLWFCQQIKKDFVVSLSGECADEIFGGYPWFYHENENSFPWLRSTDFREQLLRKEWQNKLQIKEYVKLQYEKTINEMPKLVGESVLNEKRRQLFYINMIWFMTTLLERKDRMSMRAGLEVRVPYADHRLVEYLWNVPWEMKNYQGREKGLLREALKGVLPEQVLYRKKSPYPKTHHPTFTKGVEKWLREILEDSSSVLHELFGKEKLNNFIQSEENKLTIPWFGQLMTYPQLIAYFIQIHLWFEKYRIDISGS